MEDDLSDRHSRIDPREATLPPTACAGPKRCEPLAGALFVILAAGVTSGFFLISACGRGTQGARASTRLRWEERRVELDRAASQAEAEGRAREPGREDRPRE